MTAEEFPVVLNAQAAASAAKVGRLLAFANLGRRSSAAIWRLNGTRVQRDLHPADYAGVKRLLDT